MSTTSTTDDSLRGFDRLNGSNYPTWEYAATLDLTVHDLWDLFDIADPASVPPPVYATTTAAPNTAAASTTTPSTTPATTASVAPQPTLNPDYTAWRKRATKATARLVKLVDTAHMHLIMARETPLEQWLNLAEVFSERTAQAILSKRTKLAQMHWDPYGTDSLQAFLQSMIAIGTELARANHPVSPIDMCGFIAMAMPDTLQQSVSTLKRIGRLTPETWIRDLAEDEKAFKLHKPGAVAKVNRVEASERRGRPRGECWKCHDKGHVQKDCPTLSEEERRTLRRQHEDRQRARGNGRIVALESKLSAVKAKALAAGVTFDGDDDANPSPRVYAIRVGATPSITAQPPADGLTGTRPDLAPDHITFTGSLDDERPILLTHAKAAAALSESVDPRLVILDSGCTRHVSSDRDSLVNYQPVATPRKVTVADEGTVDAIGVGDLCVWTRAASGKMAMTVFKHTLHVPGIVGTLLSVRQLCGSSGNTVRVLFFVDHCEIWGADRLELRCELVDDLYVLKRVPPPSRLSSSVSPTHLFLLRAMKAKAVAAVHPEVAHRRLGHLNMNDVRHISRDGLLNGLEVDKGSGAGTCEPCLLGKARRLPFHSRPRCDTPLKLVHSDIVGPFEVETTGRARFFVTFRDDHTRVGSAYLIRNKSEALDKFKEWRAWAERSIQLRVQGFHSDNGGEYIGDEFLAYLRDNNIEYTRSHAHTPQENGVAERYNGIILPIVRTVLQESGLPARFWGEAVRYAAYTINFRPSAALDGAIPMALWTQSTPDASHLRSFGCDAYCYILPDSARSKSKPTAVKCKLTGYTRTGYRVWDPASRRFRESKHVVCVENYGGGAGEPIPAPSEEVLARAYDMARTDGDGWENDVPDAVRRRPDPPDLVEEVLGLPPDDIPLEDVPVNVAPDQPAGEAPEPGFEDVPEQPEPVGLRRSGRVRQQPARLRDMVPSDPVEQRRWQARANAARPQADLTPLDVPASDPKNLKEALASAFADKWLEAIARENQVLTEMKTFEVVEDLPPGAKAIGCRYAFKYKPADNVFKARLVAQGFSQRPGIDFTLTFSPVTKSPSVRLVYALAALHNLLLFTADFVSAFLNGELKEKIYLRMPDGADKAWMGKYLRLLKSIYGLKQGARVWWENVERAMLELGFERASSDWCLFVRRRHGKTLLIAVHVDDMLGAATDAACWDEFCSEMNLHFKIKNLGTATHILGTEVVQDLDAGTVRITNRRYLEDVAKRYNMWDAKPISTPLDPGIHLSHADCPTDDDEKAEMSQIPYLSAIGSVLYAAGATRPDVAHAAAFLARFSANPGRKHWQALKRVLAYLRHTLDYGITYRRDGNNTIYGYTDADHGGCLDTARSTSGYVFMLAGGAITWSSKRQTVVSESTLEAEYIAAAHATKEAMWLLYCLSEIGFPTQTPIPIRCDNNGAITITKNPAEHQRTKHMHRKYHYIRERAAAEDISLVRCDTSEQLADFLTKPVPRDKFTLCISGIGVSPSPHAGLGGSSAHTVGLSGSVTTRTVVRGRRLKRALAEG